MVEMRILTEADLREIISLDLETIACVENAFRALAGGEVRMPPILRLDIPAHRGEVDVKTAYIPNLDSFAIKISPGFFNNPSIGLPSTNGLMIQFSAKTGLIEALLLDNGYLTDVRTAAAGAVAAKYLARDDAHIATIFGAGMQAKLQLQALALVRPITRARIWAREYDKAEHAARQLRDMLGIPVQAIREARMHAAAQISSSQRRLRIHQSSRQTGWRQDSISRQWARMLSTRTNLTLPFSIVQLPTSQIASNRRAGSGNSITQ